MTGDENPKKKNRRLLGVVFSLLSLIVLTYIAITLITGRGLSLSQLTSLFRARIPVETVDELHFNVGRNRVFADLGGSFAAAGTLGIQVLNAGGVETLREPFRMSSPAIMSTEGRAVAFDVGGTSVRVFNGLQITASLETGAAIVAASVNRNGWFSVCTQDGGAYRSVVVVHDHRGRNVYRVSLASGYVLSAVLSSDNRSLAVLSLTDDGSRITFYDLSSESAGNEFYFPDRLILDMRYLPGGEVLAVSPDSLILIDRNGAGTELYDFSGRRLSGYALDGGFIVLYLLDYGIGHHGRLVTVDVSSGLLSELPTDKEIVSLSSGRDFLAVLRSDGLSFYDADLNEIPPDPEGLSIAGATRVVALGRNAALVAGDHSAVVISIEGSAGY